MPGERPRGAIAAAITPRNRNEEIDFGSGFELIDFLCRGGVSGIALFAPTGEYASLSPTERSRFLCLAVKRSRADIYAGVGAATLDGAVCLARGASDAGADALLLPPPHGLPYSQEDLREFYFRFAEHSEDLPPVYLMDSPGLCSAIAPATAAELIASGAFAGTADFLSEAACALPERAAACCAEGKPDELLSEFESWADRFPRPAAVKAALELRRIKSGPLAMPLTPAKQRLLEEFRAWFKTALAASTKLKAHA